MHYDMNILAFDTATHACTVALQAGDKVIWRHEITPNEQTAHILPMMDALLIEVGLSLAQLDGLAFGQGPGSFMGVRIAASLAQGIGFGSDLPVVPLSTLQTIATGLYREQGAEAVAVAWDARMGEIYWGQYAYDTTQAAMVAMEADALVLPEKASVLALAEHSDVLIGAGNGWAVYEENLRKACGEPVKAVFSDCYPQARDMLALAAKKLAADEGVSAQEAQPIYLRNPDYSK